jgi:SAM-dependent methyltransferase
VAGVSGVRKLLHEAKVSALFGYYRTFKSGRTIEYQGRTYPYLYRRYNLTVRNERAVEVPIFVDLVNQYPADRVLEVGNVLAHYFPVSHDRLDKYERAPGVVNADVVDFQPGKTYDLIVCISTLEHVGWDEQPRDPSKMLRAIENLRSLLAPGGKLAISLPLGYNAEVDRLVRARELPFTSVGYLKRDADNRWREVSWQEVQGMEYNHYILTANALVIGIIENRTGA